MNGTLIRAGLVVLVIAGCSKSETATATAEESATAAQSATPATGPAPAADPKPSGLVLSPAAHNADNSASHPGHNPGPVAVDPTLPRVAIIIDDVGLRRNAIDVFWAVGSLRNRLTWAVIPGTPHAASLAKELLAHGETLLFHIPMESMDPKQMTPSLEPYLRVSDSAEKIQNTLALRLGQLPAGVANRIHGLSNHQGSRFSTQPQAMGALMGELKKRKLFYVDSRTTAETIAEQAAKKHQVAFARRHVFLDNVVKVPAIRTQLQELAERAQQNGKATAIGHPYPQTAIAIAAWAKAHEGKLQIVPVHHLVATQ